MKNLTKSQMKAIQDEFLSKGYKVKVTFTPESSRARVFVTVSEHFSYHIYIGKRGKFYENSTGDY